LSYKKQAKELKVYALGLRAWVDTNNYSMKALLKDRGKGELTGGQVLAVRP
jgi:hypothetical protein